MTDVELGFEFKDDALEDAVGLIFQYGQIDGDHHKAWLLDQVARTLLSNYDEVIVRYRAGEDGPETYSWDEGIAP